MLESRFQKPDEVTGGKWSGCLGFIASDESHNRCLCVIFFTKDMPNYCMLKIYNDRIIILYFNLRYS